MTAEIRAQIMEKAIEYGTGRDTLRCLALATADTPMDPSDMDLNESSKFAKYEVCAPPPRDVSFLSRSLQLFCPSWQDGVQTLENNLTSLLVIA